jgi:hypothetical protein
MIWNFLRTKQRFWVEPMSFESLYSFYSWEDRGIWLQQLHDAPPRHDRPGHRRCAARRQ